MWHMKWLSRLKRFKLDLNSGDDSFGSNVNGADDTVQSNNQQGPNIMGQAKKNMINGLGGGVQIDDFILH
jgi:hypothetical protein